MSTPVSLHYRCQLPGGTKTGLPVFNDLNSVRTGPLSARVGLGRLLTVPRLLDEPVVVVVADEADLADPLDQQAVSALLRGTKSELVIAGQTVVADTGICTVLDELEQAASSQLARPFRSIRRPRRQEGRRSYLCPGPGHWLGSARSPSCRTTQRSGRMAGPIWIGQRLYAAVRRPLHDPGSEAFKTAAT